MQCEQCIGIISSYHSVAEQRMIHFKKKVFCFLKAIVTNWPQLQYPSDISLATKIVSKVELKKGKCFGIIISTQQSILKKEKKCYSHDTDCLQDLPFMSVPQSQMKYHQSKMKDCLGCHAVSIWKWYLHLLCMQSMGGANHLRMATFFPWQVYILLFGYICLANKNGMMSNC